MQAQNQLPNVSSDFELNLPTPIYPKLQIGVISNRSRLDDILDACKIKYEQYILYVEAIKVRAFSLVMSSAGIDIQAQEQEKCVPCLDPGGRNHDQERGRERHGQGDPLLLRADRVMQQGQRPNYQAWGQETLIRFWPLPDGPKLL